MSNIISIAYEGELRCQAMHELSGTTITTDAPADHGGKAEHFSPTDLAAAALGTCVITIMGIYAQKAGIELKGTKVTVDKEMSDKPPRRIARVKLTIAFPKGLELSDKDRTKLERIVNTCPVKQSLHPDVDVVAEFV